jgi:glycerophosphoryl diester phosphodiesterase
MKSPFTIAFTKILLACLPAFCLFLVSCKESGSSKETYLIGHRGYGASTYHNNKSYPENSREAIEAGLKHFDGIEIDIQASADGTLWIYHDSFLPGSSSCIPSSTDEQINAINNSLKKNEKIERLQDLIPLFAENHNKFISLDIKVWFEKSCVPNNTMAMPYYLEIADSICHLFDSPVFDKRLLIEAPYFAILQRIEERKPLFKTFFLSFGVLDKQLDVLLKKNVDGISIGYDKGQITAPKIEALHSKNKLIQVWTINKKESFEMLRNLNPDFIQTDNRELMALIKT